MLIMLAVFIEFFSIVNKIKQLELWSSNMILVNCSLKVSKVNFFQITKLNMLVSNIIWK